MCVCLDAGAQTASEKTRYRPLPPHLFNTEIGGGGGVSRETFSLSLFIYILYIYVCVCLCVFMYIQIDRYVFTVFLCMNTYIYISIDFHMNSNTGCFPEPENVQCYFNNYRFSTRYTSTNFLTFQCGSYKQFSWRSVNMLC